MKLVRILIVLIVLSTAVAHADVCENCMKPFVVPTGVDLDQYSDVLKFLDGSQNKLSPSEREYWKLRQELSETGIALLKKIKDNEMAIEDKIMQVVYDETRQPITTLENLLAKDFPPNAQKNIKEKLKRISPNDPLDESLGLLQKRTIEIQKRLVELNQAIQLESAKKPKKVEFYDAQALYDEVSGLSLQHRILYQQRSPLLLITAISRNNEDGHLLREFNKSNDPQNLIPKLEKIAVHENPLVFEALTISYVGTAPKEGTIRIKPDHERARKYGKILLDKYGNSIGLFAYCMTGKDEDAIKYYILKSHKSSETKPLTVKLMKEYYAEANHDRYIKSGLILP